MVVENGVVRACGEQGAVIAIRLHPGADLIGGIEAVCQERGIHSAALTCIIGSLKEAVLVNAQPIADGKTGYAHGAPYSIQNVQILSAQGIVSKDEHDQYRVHIHGVVLDEHNGLHGGHFVKGHNPVLITAEIVVSEIKGVRLMRRFDLAVGRDEFSPEEE